MSKLYDYDFIIFSDIPIDNNLIEAINKINGINVIYKLIPSNIVAKKNSQFLKSLRWLYYDKLIDNYEYAYIGDVDIIISEENYPLHIQHINHMELLERPYSNVIRNKQLRMSGLHFIKVNEYLRKTESARISLMNYLKYNPLSVENNENILYKILESSKILPPETKELVASKFPWEKISFRPHHGIHLGVWRDKVKNIRKLIRLKTNYSHENHIDDYYYYKKNLQNDILFKEMVKSSGKKILKQIEAMQKDFERYLKSL